MTGHKVEQTCREIIVRSSILKIFEHTDKENEAGAVVWDAALVLLNYFCKEPRLVHEKRVIELGSGTGAVGLTAAVLGASPVLLTDLPHLLPGIERNAQVNSLQDCVTVQPLQWGSDVEGLKPPFDVIIASDLLYEAEQIPKLMLTIVSLSDSDTKTYLAFELRPNIIRSAFQAIYSYGLLAKQVPKTHLHSEWQSDDIEVFELTIPQLGT